MDTLVDQYRREYEQGWKAGQEKKEIDDCPYDIGSCARISWMVGYAAANLNKLPPQ